MAINWVKVNREFEEEPSITSKIDWGKVNEDFAEEIVEAPREPIATVLRKKEPEPVASPVLRTNVNAPEPTLLQKIKQALEPAKQVALDYFKKKVVPEPPKPGEIMWPIPKEASNIIDGIMLGASTIKAIFAVSETVKPEAETLQELMVEQEKDREVLAREQRKEERFEMYEVPETPTLPEGYKEPTGIFGTLSEGLQQTGMMVFAGIGGTIESIGIKMSSEKIREAGEIMADVGKSVVAKHPEWARDPDVPEYFKGGYNDPRWYARTLGELIPTIASVTIGSTIGGLVGGATGAKIGLGTSIFAMEGGMAYNEMLESGVNPDDAATAMGIIGTINTALESVNFMRVGKKIYGPAHLEPIKMSYRNYLVKNAPRLMKEVGTTMLIEGTTEAMQEFTQNAVSGWLDESKGLFDNVAESFAAGVLGGTVFGGVGVGVEMVRSYQAGDVFVDSNGNIMKVSDVGETVRVATEGMSDEEWNSLVDQAEETMYQRGVEADQGLESAPIEDIAPTVDEKIPETIVHATGVDISKIREKGFTLSEHGSFGDGAYFGGTAKEFFGEKKLTISTKDLKWKIFTSIKEIQDFNKGVLGTANVRKTAEAVRQEGFDGFFHGEQFVVVNKEKLDKLIKEPESKPAIDYKKRAKRMDISDLQEDIDKRIEAFREEAGLKAEREGAGVRLRPILDATGQVQWVKREFKKERAKADMARQARAMKKYAKEALYETDEAFRALQDEFDRKMSDEVQQDIAKLQEKLTDEIAEAWGESKEALQETEKQLTNKINKIEEYETQQKEVTPPQIIKEEDTKGVEEIALEDETEEQKQDWEDNYADRVAEINDKRDKLVAELKTAKESEQESLKDRINALVNEELDITNEFMDKWQKLKKEKEPAIVEPYEQPTPTSKKRGREPGREELPDVGEMEEGEQKVVDRGDIEGEGVRATGFDRSNNGVLRERPTERVLTEQERDDALAYTGKGGLKGAEGRGVLDEYFTPFPIIKKLWGLATKHGFEGGKVLEPSAGIGRFFEFAPDNAELTGIEMDIENARIMARLYPEATIYQKPFEDFFVDEKGKPKKFEADYDLVIGNPPFGTQRQFYKNLGEEPKIANLETYFIKRSLDLLKDGGLLIYIVPSSFLRSKTSYGKGEIAKMVQMPEMYRLPNGLFQGTNVGTDILVFKKTKNGPDQIKAAIQFLSDDFASRMGFVKPLGQKGEVKTRFGLEDGIIGDISDIEKIDVAEPTRRPIEKRVEEKPIEETKETLLKKVSNLYRENLKNKNLGEGIFEKQWVEQMNEQIENPERYGEIGEEENSEGIKIGDKLTAPDGDIVTVVSIVDNSVGTISPKNYGGWIDISLIKNGVIKKEGEAPAIVEPEAKPAGIGGLFDAEISVVEKPIKTGPKHLQTRKLISDDEIYSIHTQVDGILDENTPQNLLEKAPVVYRASVAKYYSPYNYYQGEIYDKLNKLEKDFAEKLISSEKYTEQKTGLLDVLPEKADIRDINISPNSRFVSDVLIKHPDGGEMELGEYFKIYLEDLSRDAFGDSSKWEVEEYVERQIVRGGDKEYNQKVKNRRRRTAQKLFTSFLQSEISGKNKQKIEDLYNRRFNGYYSPDTKQVPRISIISDTFNGNPLVVREHQKEAIGFLINKGAGLLAHDVGAGKTLSSIVAINEVIARGWAKRPLVIVPTQTYKNWIKEIRDILPDIKINELKNLGTKVLVPKIEDNSISIMTYEGLRNFGLRPENQERITSELTDNLKTPGEKTERQKATEEQVAMAMAGKAARGAEVYLEDLGIDHLTIDEIHNFKNIFTGAQVEKGEGNEYSNVRGSSSARGVKLFYLTQHILNSYNNRNVFGLSATPFTNSPLEIYNILSLFGKYKLAEKSITNVNEFMSYFMNMQFKHVVKAEGKIELADIVEEFKNLGALQEIVKEFIDFKGAADLDLQRPEKHRRTHRLGLNAKQVEHMVSAQDIFGDKEAGGAIAAITEMQNIVLSPFLSRYNTEKFDYKEFVEQSPKIKYAVDHIAEIKKTAEKRGENIGQIIYMSRGVNHYKFIKEYLIKEVGFAPSDIEFIKGGVTPDEKFNLSNRFRAGDIKVLIGSEAMKEGINLQDNATDMYYLHLPWNPTDIVQAEGRIWRQGNQWANVRIHFPLLENSVDSFLFQKLETKAKRIQNIWSYKGDVLNVADIDPEELKLDLITDPVAKTEAEFTFKRFNFENNLRTLKSEKTLKTGMLGKLQEVDEEIKDEKEELKDPDIKDWYKENTLDRIANFSKKRAKILKRVSEKGINLEELKVISDEFETKIEAVQEQLDNFEETYQKAIKEAAKKQAEPLVIEKSNIEIMKTLIDSFKQENPELLIKTEVKHPKKVAPGAAVDVFADIPAENQHYSIVPELVGLAKELTGNLPRINKRLRRALGRAVGATDISLKPDIFKDPQIVAKVLAHEIGHIVHNIPPNIKPSTLLRKLTILDIQRKHLHFTATQIREELWALSTMWRPLTEDSDMQYRKSSAELYADFISVLLNNPGLLEEYAPTFYEQWFNFIEAKPAVKNAYFDLQKILHGDASLLHDQREADLMEDLMTAKEMDKRMIARIYGMGKKVNVSEIGKELNRLLVEKHLDTYKKVREAMKKGDKIKPENRPDLLLEEIDLIQNDVSEVFEKIQPIEEAYKAVGVSDEEFSNFLYYKRILGDRGAFANPRGHNPITAQQQLDGYAKLWGDEKYQAIENAVAEFQKVYKEYFKFGFENGFYEQEMFDELYNDQNVYVSFRVLDHYLEGFVSAKMMHQIGTLKGIANTFQSTIAKMVAIKVGSIKNNAKRQMANMLQETFTTEVIVADIDHKTGYVKPKQDFGIIRWRENGKLRALYTDPYIADSFNFEPMHKSTLTAGAVKWINSKVFRKLYLDYSVRFIMRNPVRDLTQAFAALQLHDLQGTGKLAVSSVELAKAVKEAYPEARAFSKEEITEATKEMLGLKIFKLIQDTPVSQETIDEATALEREMLKRRIAVKKTYTKNPLAKLGNFIEQTSKTNEAITKIAAYKIIKKHLAKAGKTMDKETAAYIRNNIGTPNYMRGGRWTPTTNTAFMFSNVALQGYRRYYEVGLRDPNSRSGYQWKKAQIAVVPKLVMAAMFFGLLGDRFEEMIKSVSKYRLSNYLVFPLFKTKTGKVVSITIPQDYDDQLIGGMMWWMFESIDKGKVEGAQIFSTLMKAIPSLSTTLMLPAKWIEYFMGKNPVDDYRGWNILTDDEFTAGGIYSLVPLTKWSFNQAFGGIIKAKVRDSIRQETVLEKVLKIPGLNAFVDVSDYGVREEVGAMLKPIRQKQAIERIEKTGAINDAVRQYHKGEDPGVVFDNLIRTVYGGQEIKKATITALRKKFNSTIIVSYNDSNLTSLVFANTIEEQTALLQKLKDTLTPQELTKIAELFVKTKLIGINTWNDAMQEK